MSKLDRKLQNEILQLASFCYPAFCRFKFEKIEGFNLQYPLICSASLDQLWVEVNYLRDHGLIILDSNCSISPGLEGIIGYIKATAKGKDFVEDDGGLSAILSVQTVKLHRETVVVLEDLIAISNLSEQEKEKAKSTLGEMSTEALKAVVSTVTTVGLSMLLGK